MGNEEIVRTNEEIVRTTAGWQEPGAAMVQESQKRGPKQAFIIIGLILTAIIIVCVAVYGILRLRAGDSMYTIQMEQYAVKYSERYEYEEVITVEYPRLEGLDSEVEEQLNSLLYQTAMDRVNYWHFQPDSAVRKFQEEYFSIFCSNVDCYVTFHSQDLLSVDMREIYDTYNPVWEVKYTERAVNANLDTGEVYELKDILTIDSDFMALWCDALSEKTGEEFSAEEEKIFLEWFLGGDQELGQYYLFRPWFYIEGNGDFVIGISVDPLAAAGLSGNRTLENCTYSAAIPWQDLDAFRLEGGRFWELYENSESVGEILECPDKEENLWFGEKGSVLSYWEDVQ